MVPMMNDLPSRNEDMITNLMTEGVIQGNVGISSKLLSDSIQGVLEKVGLTDFIKNAKPPESENINRYKRTDGS